jgi:hypothetical protein
LIVNGKYLITLIVNGKYLITLIPR